MRALLWFMKSLAAIFGAAATGTENGPEAQGNPHTDAGGSWDPNG